MKKRFTHRRGTIFTEETSIIIRPNTYQYLIKAENNAELNKTPVLMNNPVSIGDTIHFKVNDKHYKGLVSDIHHFHQSKSVIVIEKAYQYELRISNDAYSYV